MKKILRITPFIAIFVLLFSSSCNKGTDRRNCMLCNGCFGSWTECEADYHQDSLHPLTWNEYVDANIAENPMSTKQCERGE